jgi:small subunit ribosomal protein S17e
MGRIRTTFVKRTAEKIMRLKPEAFTTKFEENKHKIVEYAEIPSKKLRNLIAGYITKKVKIGDVYTLKKKRGE